MISGSRAAAPVFGCEASPESARAGHEVGSLSAGAPQGEGSLSAEADHEVGSFSAGADHEDGSFSPGADCGGFSVSQVNGKYWYRWDTQCSYESKVWKVWDGKNMKWINLSVPCPRPSAYKWNHVKFEGKRVDGKTQFVSITLNGKKSYVNKYVGPTWLGYYDPNVGIHFQLNGNRYMTDYYVWGDRFKLNYW